MISAKVIADSKNEYGNRITTMIVTFPRIILAEFNTHRMFSRNSASSRAIPFEKMVKSVEENPFIPIAWQKDHKGMQGTEYHQLVEMFRGCWLDSRDKAVKNALFLSEHDVTKQLCNRILEPFMWHTVIVTATEWENFFALRCPKYEWRTGSHDGVYRSVKDIAKYQGHNVEEFNISSLEWLKFNNGQAEIHMMALAEAMWDAYNESTPKELKAGDWHIPFDNQLELEKVMGYAPLLRVKVATAMCARVSYTVVGEEDKPINYENDIKLHDKLLASGHMSPFEHCAQVAKRFDGFYESGNFKGGWIQYRKTIAGENKTL